MSGVLRVMRKDLGEVTSNPRLVLLALVVPPLILLLVGQLSIRPPSVRVLVAGLADCLPAASPEEGPTSSSLAAARWREPAALDVGARFSSMSLTPEQRMTLIQVSDAGMLVTDVVPGSAAEAADLREGDVLVAVDRTPVVNDWQIEDLIRSKHAGDEVTFTIMRYQQQQSLLVSVPASVPAESSTFRYLRELSYVHVDCRQVPVETPLRELTEGDFDMLLNIRTVEEQQRWDLFVEETNPRRLPWLLELAHGIQLSRQDMPDLSNSVALIHKMSALGALPVRSALVYYPLTADRSVALLPRTFCLIVCFLAFVLAAPSLIREREGHTLEILLGAPGIDGNSVLLGKCLASVALALLAAIVMLVVVQVTYHLYVKANAMLFLIFLLLPVLSSTLLGMIVSALARSQVQTVMAAAVYFFALLLLSGFLYPTAESASIIRIFSLAFGLTFLLDPANQWFFGAEFMRHLPWFPLTIQCAFYGALAWLAWRYQLRQI